MDKRTTKQDLLRPPSEPLGNWFKIGTEGSWYELSRIRHRRAVYISPLGLHGIRNSKKITHGFFSNNAYRTSVFVSGWFTQKAFRYPWAHHPNIWLACPALIAHSGWVGRVAMAMVAIVAGRVWNSKNWNLLSSSVSVTKRRNAPNGWFVDRTIIQEPFWSLNDRFFCFVQEFRRFDVSMRPSRQQRKLFCVKKFTSYDVDLM